MEVIGSVSGLLTIIGAVTAVAKRLNEVRDKYNNVALNTTLVASQLSTIRAALQAIAEWRSTDRTSSRPSRQLDDDLAVSLNCCAILISVIDTKLGEAGYTPGMKDKIRHLWLEDTLKEYISNLEGQVRALQLLLTIFQCRTVTEQRQKLEQEESRTIIENVQAETASLRLDNANFQDAASILSMDPSVNFDVDSILLKSPAYMRVYGNRRPRISELPSQALPTLELPPQTTTPSNIPAHILAPPELSSEAPPPLPPRPQTRSNTSNPLSVRNQDEQQDDPHRHPAIYSTELPAGNTLVAVELEARAVEIKRPIELPATMESEDSCIGIEEFGSAMGSQTSLRLQTEPLSRPSQLTTEALGSDAVYSVTIAPNASRPRSKPDELYDGSVRAMGNKDKSRPESTSPYFDTCRDDDDFTVRSGPSSSVNLVVGGVEGRTISPQESGAADGEIELGIGNEDGHAPSRTESSVETSSVMPAEPEDHQLDDGVPRPLRVRSSSRPFPAETDYNSITPVSRAAPRPNDSPTRDEPKSISNNIELVSSGPFPDDGLILSNQEETMEAASQSGQSSSELDSIVGRTCRDKVNCCAIDVSANNAPGASMPEDFPVTHPDFDVEPATSYSKEDSSNFIPSPRIDLEDFQTSLESQIDDQLRELQNHTEKLGMPPQPTRPPPPPQLFFSSVTPSPPIHKQPNQSIDSIASGLQISGLPNRSSMDHNSSLYGVDSAASSTSQQDLQTTQSSPTILSSDTMDTSMSTHLQYSLKGQAQAELRELQLQLEEANRRGDTHTAKSSVQRSIELIQRTYLSGSVVGELSSSTEPVNRLGFSRNSLMRLSSFSTLGRSAKTSALIEAASTGDLTRLRSLLEDKVNVNARGDKYRTSQMAAAINGHLGCLQLLKIYAADEFAIDSQGRTVMHVAVTANQLEVVNWLLGAYAPSPTPNQRSWKLFRAADKVMDRISHKLLREVSDAEGSKPLHLAAKLNLNKMVDLLLAAGADVSAKNHWGRTALHEAIWLNLTGIAQTLVSSGAEIGAVDMEKFSPLHLAAKRNHKESITFLLANNAYRYDYDRNGDLPIHVAGRQGNIAAIEALIGDRTDLGRTTKHGETLIHIACLTNGLTLAEYLVQNTVDVNTWATPQNSSHSVLALSTETKRPSGLPQTPLHYACTAGLYEMSVSLLDAGAWVNATPDDGKTPLMMATESGNTNLVCLLLARGAKVNAAMPGSCLTAMHLSARRGDLETTQVLFRGGANMLARTNDFHTPWEYSVTRIKDNEKRKAIDDYFRRINEVRIFNAKKAAHPQGNPTGNQREWTLQGNTNPNMGIVAGYPPYPGTGPPQSGPWQSQTYPGPPAQAVYSQQFIDIGNNAFPEAPPAYTHGSSAPRNLADRPPVHRPTSG